MRFKNEILWRVIMTRQFVNRDGVVTDHEKEIMKGLDFLVTEKETGKVVSTNVMDYNSHTQTIPADQKDLTL